VVRRWLRNICHASKKLHKFPNKTRVLRSEAQTLINAEFNALILASTQKEKLPLFVLARCTFHAAINTKTAAHFE
jgi:protein associated with RNAse G/E